MPAAGSSTPAHWVVRMLSNNSLRGSISDTPANCRMWSTHRRVLPSERESRYRPIPGHPVLRTLLFPRHTEPTGTTHRDVDSFGPMFLLFIGVPVGPSLIDAERLAERHNLYGVANRSQHRVGLHSTITMQFCDDVPVVTYANASVYAKVGDD